MVDANDLAAAKAIKFCDELVRAAEKDSSGKPLKYLKDQLAKLNPIADNILANAVYQTIDDWKRPFE
ncbi:MAG TPA: hypothetical protein VED24_04135 [Candidatus Acidoferrum sp.]|nr:hypothetical protein [Candidatus Acidoferrum sp.]